MSESPANQPAWYTLTVETATEKLQVDPAQGLSTAEAQAALQSETPAQE